MNNAEGKVEQVNRERDSLPSPRMTCKLDESAHIYTEVGAKQQGVTRHTAMEAKVESGRTLSAIVRLCLVL